ncbi:MAG: hypothetical protein ACE5H4_06805 [Candidatus Thorarchaeota archaeon]
MASENQKEKELDELLLLLSQPLTRLILSVLAGLDPYAGAKKASVEADRSNDALVENGFD